MMHEGIEIAFWRTGVKSRPPVMTLSLLETPKPVHGGNPRGVRRLPFEQEWLETSPDSDSAA